MSLINEALKKAQRQRTEEQADLLAPMPGGGGHGDPRIAKRGGTPSTQSVMLLAAGGIALFVVCVVVAVIWINRPSPAKPVAIKPAVAKTSSEAPAPATIVVPLTPPATGAVKTSESVASPAISNALTLARPAAEGTPPTMSSARSAPISDLASSARAESSAAPRELASSFARPADPVPAKPAATPGKFDERIQAIVDGFRVAGIRSSGTGSKVLLNEKVFKINDVVDRTNGLRLTQVANDSLTFTTPDGVTYVKNF